MLKKNNQDPDNWILELELMKIRLKKMGTPIDEQSLIMHIMNSLPSIYESLIENEEDRLDNIMDPLTMSILRDKLSEKYEKLERGKGSIPTNLMRVKKMRRGFFLSRPSKEDATSMECLITRQSNVGLVVDRMITGGKKWWSGQLLWKISR